MQSSAAHLPVGDDETTPALRLVGEPGRPGIADDGAVVINFPRTPTRARAATAPRPDQRGIGRMALMVAVLAVTPFVALGPRVVAMMSIYQLSAPFLLVSLGSCAMLLAGIARLVMWAMAIAGVGGPRVVARRHASLTWGVTFYLLGARLVLQLTA